jgi:hypothetical protein
MRITNKSVVPASAAIMAAPCGSVAADQNGLGANTAIGCPDLTARDRSRHRQSRRATRITFTLDAVGTVSGAVLNPGHWEQQGVRID